MKNTLKQKTPLDPYLTPQHRPPRRPGDDTFLENIGYLILAMTVFLVLFCMAAMLIVML